MSLKRAKEYLESKGFGDRIIITEHSSATVAEAAEALGCEPGMIVKTLSFLQGEKPVLILAEGMVRIDNQKYVKIGGRATAARSFSPALTA